MSQIECCCQRPGPFSGARRSSPGSIIIALILLLFFFILPIASIIRIPSLALSMFIQVFATLLIALLALAFFSVVFGASRNKPRQDTAYVRSPTQPVETVAQRFCCYCGSAISVPDSRFCSNCGASLADSVGNKASSLGTEKLGTVTMPSKTMKANVRCMICGRPFEQGDLLIWCPHCGGIAHRVHLLEWLHVKGTCPACGEHLDEQELAEQLSQRMNS